MTFAPGDAAIRVPVARLARPRRSGGRAIEAAAPPARAERGARPAVAQAPPRHHILPADAVICASGGATQGRETP